MSKLIAAGFAGSGVVAASVGGTLLMRQGNDNSISEEENTKAEEKKVSNVLSTKTGEEFKENGKSGECVTKYFGGENLDFKNSNTAFSESNKVDANYFSSSSSGSKGCLVLNWEKKGPVTTGDNKWTGKLRWVGSFVNGDKGFVMFTLIKPSATTDATLELEGGVYVLEKKETESNGTVKGSREIDSGNKTINSGSFSNMFPTVGSALGLNDAALKTNWGFINDASTELSKLCKSEESDNCPSTTDSSKEFKGSWTWEKTGTGNEKGSKGSENIDTGIAKLYPNQNGLDLKGALGNSSSIKGTNPNLTKPTENSTPVS